MGQDKYKENKMILINNIKFICSKKKNI